MSKEISFKSPLNNSCFSFSHPQLGSSNSFRPSPLDLPDAPRVLTETVPGTESLPRPADVIKVREGG